MTDSIKASNTLLDRLFEVGAHFGFGKSRRHPTTANYIYTSKNGTDIIDLEKTATGLAEAKEYVKKLGEANKKIVFVGNKSEAVQMVRNTAEKIGVPYVAERWVGGTLTNFGEIRKRIARLRELEEGKAKDGWSQYTKNERAILQKETDQLHRFFDGIYTLAGLPAALIVVDPREESTAVREAKDMKVAVVALANTDCDLTNITRAVVANDASTGTIALFLQEMADSYVAGRAEAEKKAAEEKAKSAQV